MSDLPGGTVTFVFTDIEGSTALLQHLGDVRFSEVLTEHGRLIRSAFQKGGGQELDTQGDSFLVAFPRARDALAASVEVQRGINTSPWPGGVSLRVRMGLHTGEPLHVADRYVGLDVHRAARICSAAHGGQVLLSQTARDLVEHDLPPGVSLRDLGEHRLKDLQRPERIFQLLHAELPVDFPPLRSLDVLPNNLPIHLTSFVGRNRETAEVKRLLPTSRLLTITGVGGCGKTRLALQVAADLLEEFPDGVWLVELGTLSDSELVAQRVASAMSVREEAGRPVLATLADHLRQKQLLLLVDNCEHLVGACAHLVETLLKACPRLHVLCTSREALGVPGEIAWHLASLTLPDPHGAARPESLMQCDGTRLFIERAVVASRAFNVTDQNASWLADVCRRLDGIPLAIELAAARTTVLTVQQIAVRLDDCFRLLTGGGRTVLPRHQTLLAAMDWSYGLLSEQERALLRRLSVFAGGWTLEAAEGVCAWEGIETHEVLDLLTHLVAKSLVAMEERDGEARYHLVETVRQYCRDKLRESGEAGVYERHRNWFLQLVERAKPELQGPDQRHWLNRLEQEHDNLRAALQWSQMEPGSGEAGLTLVAGLWRFWEVHGYLIEGRGWLERMLQRTGGQVSDLRASALSGAGILAYRQGDYVSAAGFYEESLALYRQLENGRGIAFALANLGSVASQQGDHARTRSLYEESLAAVRDSGDQRDVAFALINVAGATEQLGDYARARALYEESVATFEALRDKWGMAHALNNLGLMACRQHDLASARSLHERALVLQRELSDGRGVARTLHNLADVAMQQGESAWAKSLCTESLAIRRELGDRSGIAATLERLARIAATAGDPERAARLLGAAEALRAAIGAPLPASGRADYDHTVAGVQAGLGDEGFADARVKGRAMELEEAIRYALEEPRT